MEAVQSSAYLDVELNTRGSEKLEIQNQIMSVNEVYIALSYMYRFNTIHKELQIKVYKTIIRPTLCYGCETKVITENARELNE